MSTSINAGRAPLGLQHQLLLRDGTPVTWRYVLPSDRASFEAGLADHLSARSRQQRFHSPAVQLPPAVWDNLVDRVDQDAHIALVMHAGTEGVAVAHVLRQPGRWWVADVAVTVADRWQGRGAGSLLLREAIAVAGDIETIDTLVMADNEAALRMLGSLGPVTVDCADGQCRVQVDLTVARAA
jgi:acetyltransferase